MKILELTLARIGNSRGIRLPAELIQRHGFEGGILMEETEDVIVLRPKTTPAKKLSWEQTAREMRKHDEDWSDWTGTLADGLDDIPWNHPRRQRAILRKPVLSPTGPTTRRVRRKADP